jgi:hypothetical protein
MKVTFRDRCLARAGVAALLGAVLLSAPGQAAADMVCDLDTIEDTHAVSEARALLAQNGFAVDDYMVVSFQHSHSYTTMNVFRMHRDIP